VIIFLLTFHYASDNDNRHPDKVTEEQKEEAEGKFQGTHA
jgi:hypothetical protein